MKGEAQAEKPAMRRLPSALCSIAFVLGLTSPAAQAFVPSLVSGVSTATTSSRASTQPVASSRCVDGKIRTFLEEDALLAQRLHATRGDIFLSLT